MPWNKNKGRHLAVYKKRNNANVYRGLTFGTIIGIPSTIGVIIKGPAIYAQNAPIYLVTYAPLLFSKTMQITPRQLCNFSLEVAMVCMEKYGGINLKAFQSNHKQQLEKPCGAILHGLLFF
jgi:hypothetical protein